MTAVIDPIPRPHLPRPVQVPDGAFLTLAVDADTAAWLQVVVRERNAYLAPVEGTENDLDPVYRIVRTGRRR